VSYFLKKILAAAKTIRVILRRCSRGIYVCFVYKFRIFPWYIDWIYYRSQHGKRFARNCDYVHDVADKLIRERRQVLVIYSRPALRVRYANVRLMNVERRQAAADPQTKPNDLGCESACRLPESTPTIAVYYYYSARKLILILPFRGGQKAEST